MGDEVKDDAEHEMEDEVEEKVTRIAAIAIRPRRRW